MKREVSSARRKGVTSAGEGNTKEQGKKMNVGTKEGNCPRIDHRIPDQSDSEPVDSSHCAEIRGVVGDCCGAVEFLGPPAT